MVTCPRCKFSFPENTATQQAFEAFHAIRDEYSKAQGLTKVDAKDLLCVLYGVSKEYEEPWEPPKYPGIFCRVWGRLFFRKSTLAYSPAEMHTLIEASQEAIGGQNGL